MNRSHLFLFSIISLSIFSCSAMELVPQSVQYAINIGSYTASNTIPTVSQLFGLKKNQPIQSDKLVNEITQPRQNYFDGLDKFNDIADFVKANPKDNKNLSKRWQMVDNLKPVRNEVLFFASYSHPQNTEQESQRIIIIDHIIEQLNDTDKVQLDPDKMALYQCFINTIAEFTIKRETNHMNFGSSTTMLEVSQEDNIQNIKLSDECLNELLSECPKLKEELNLRKQKKENERRKNEEEQRQIQIASQERETRKQQALAEKARRAEEEKAKLEQQRQELMRYEAQQQANLKAEQEAKEELARGQQEEQERRERIEKIKQEAAELAKLEEEKQLQLQTDKCLSLFEEAQRDEKARIKQEEATLARKQQVQQKREELARLEEKERQEEVRRQQLLDKTAKIEEEIRQAQLQEVSIEGIRRYHLIPVFNKDMNNKESQSALNTKPDRYIIIPSHSIDNDIVELYYIDKNDIKTIQIPLTFFHNKPYDGSRTIVYPSEHENLYLRLPDELLAIIAPKKDSTAEKQDEPAKQQKEANVESQDETKQLELAPQGNFLIPTFINDTRSIKQYDNTSYSIENDIVTLNYEDGAVKVDILQFNPSPTVDYESEDKNTIIRLHHLQKVIDDVLRLQPEVHQKRIEARTAAETKLDSSRFHLIPIINNPNISREKQLAKNPNPTSKHVVTSYSINGDLVTLNYTDNDAIEIPLKGALCASPSEIIYPLEQVNLHLRLPNDLLKEITKKLSDTTTQKDLKKEKEQTSPEKKSATQEAKPKQTSYKTKAAYTLLTGMTAGIFAYIAYLYHNNQLNTQVSHVMNFINNVMDKAKSKINTMIA